MNNRVFHIHHEPIFGDSLALTKDDEPIPQDEPLFILRARDTQALSTIRIYQSTMPPTSEGWKIIQAVINDFTEFKQKNPDIMGNPNEVY